MTDAAETTFVSRAGQKLSAALDRFAVDVTGRICADLGSHVGGFADCLLQRGAATVYSVDTSYGTLAWKLRKDPRVVVLERTNAMHVELPEPVDLVTIDVGWTPQAKVLPNVGRMLKSPGEGRPLDPSDAPAQVITLIKPHYEAPKGRLTDGVLLESFLDEVIGDTTAQMVALGWTVVQTMESPIRGHGGNREFLALLQRP